jgi:hypothetical protein
MHTLAVIALDLLLQLLQLVAAFTMCAADRDSLLLIDTCSLRHFSHMAVREGHGLTCAVAIGRPPRSLRSGTLTLARVIQRLVAASCSYTTSAAHV